MARVRNPILPGFHPDPSICRAADGWYYLATSTFEWWPGVRIHRSRDLANWELASYAVTRRSQLDLRGTPDSGGVWAPCLSFSDGRFWLIYSDVKSLNGPFKDVRNYLITAERIEGPWSEPVLLNASGFDPSLFHDTDGRKWLVCQLWRGVPDLTCFAGISLQEYSVAEQRLIGDIRNIFRGSSLGVPEGPHLYRKDGWYYLVTAEGGTGWDHAVTVARSRKIDGPYELSPYHPLLTSRGKPELALQKSGHASFVETPSGRWFLAHLCSRPVGSHRRCILGRETALQSLQWPADEWPCLSSGDSAPREEIELSEAASAAPYVREFVDDFAAPTLHLQWNTLREPAAASWLSLTERAGFLRLRGRHSLQSAFDQSLVGFRLLHHRCTVRTRLEFQPFHFQQRAGLALFYNSANFYFAGITADESGRREVRLLVADNRKFREVAVEPLPARGAVELSARLDNESLQFFLDDRPVGGALDATILSDDYPIDAGVGWAFTGAFAVLCAQDASDAAPPADFDWFRYRTD